MLLSLAGVAMTALRPLLTRETLRLQLPPGLVPLALFMVYGLVLSVFAPSPYDARLVLLQAGSCILSYWAWTELASPHQRWRVLFGVLFLAVTLIAWYALIQHRQYSTAVLFRDRPEVYGMRASGTYLCPNHFANLIELLLPFCLAVVTTASAGPGLRILSVYSLALFLPVLYLTQSRSGWIAGTLGLAGTGMLLAWRQSVRTFVTTVLVLATLGILASTVLWHTAPSFKERVGGMSMNAPDEAVKIRLLMWGDTLDMIAEKPVFGHGPDAWEWEYPRFQKHDVQLYFDLAHQEFLQLLAEYGLIGFLLVACAVGALALCLIRALGSSRQRTAALAAAALGTLAAALLHACFDFTFHIFANVQVLVLLFGIVIASLFAAGDRQPRRWAPALHHAWTAGVLLLVVVTGVSAARFYLSDKALRTGKALAEDFDYAGALASYERAVKIRPDDWRAWMGMGEVLQTQAFWTLDQEEKRGKAQAAAAAYEETLAHNTASLEAHFSLSKTLKMLDRPEEAAEHIRHVVRFAPRSAFYRKHAADLLTRLGKDAEAREVQAGPPPRE
jgi:O-antigen ligase